MISLQVDGSITPQQFSTNLATNGLLSIWGYDSISRAWQTYAPTNNPNTLTNLLPGRGYWVKVNKANTLTLVGSVWPGPTSLVPGWNLIGFPGLTFDPTEQLDLASTFRDQLATVPRLWRYDGGTAQKFIGYDVLALPNVTDLKAVEAGKGYWVYANGNFTLTPVASIALAADGDIAPLQLDEFFDPQDSRYTGNSPATYSGQIVRYAGTEDASEDLNHNGILDSPFTQNTMFFASGVNQQNITLANVGNGLLNWSVSSTAGWITAEPPAGVTTTEQDSVRIGVNRAGLTPGFYTNSFTVTAGGSNRLVTVILQVPPVEGDYRGAATVARVNGKNILLGKVDLNLSMFNESTNITETRFRGVINRDKALLFPKDVFLNGVFYQGNDFSLTTSFESTPGDRNTPPYTTFQHSNDPYGDKDYNGNGILDNLNPFPFSIYRQVTLLGRRTTPDRLEGTYIEAIENALPSGQVIYLEGTFQLDRESLNPTKKSIYNGKTTNAPVQIGGSSGGRSSYTNILTVPNNVQIQGVTVTVKIDFPSPSQLQIVLRGPTGITVPLFQNGSSLPSATTYTTSAFNGTSGQGPWSLITSWNSLSGERGYFNGWELNLQGLAFFSATGSVATVTGGVTNNVSGANLLLSGSNLLPQSNTSTNGQFEFNQLTENSYVLNVSKLGYNDASVFFRVTSSNVNLGNILLTPIAITQPQLVAAPAIGTAPLNVSFTPLIPTNTLASLGNNLVATWIFGDGLTQVVSNASIASLAHSYVSAGVYTARLSITGTGGTLNLTNNDITALASGPNTIALPTATNFIYGIGFIGSLASVDPTGGIVPATNKIAVLTQAGFVTNLVTGSAGTVYGETIRDSAGFDIDRDPLISTNVPFHPNAEDSDYDIPSNGFQTYTPPTVNGVAFPDRFRLVTTMGGYVFGPERIKTVDQPFDIAGDGKTLFGCEPAKVGGFVLQVGRIEE